MSLLARRRERAVHNIAASAEDNPYHRASFRLEVPAGATVWQVVYLLLYRTSPRPMHAWRAMLLRLFGAKMGPGVTFIRAERCGRRGTCSARTAARWAITLRFTILRRSILSPTASSRRRRIFVGRRTITTDPDFPMISYSMRLGAYSWICARASVSPGVHVGEGAVLGLGSVAYQRSGAMDGV